MAKCYGTSRSRPEPRGGQKRRPALYSTYPSILPCPDRNAGTGLFLLLLRLKSLDKVLEVLATVPRDPEQKLAASQRSYGLALGKTRAALGYSVQQIDRSTVLAALVLDIVEKVLSTSGRPLSAHVDGALGLVKLIGIGRFKDSTSLQVLISLTNQSMIGSLALQQPIHPDVVSLRSWLEAGLLAGQYPTGVTELFVRYAVLQSRFSTNCTANDAYVLECYSMDSEIAGLELNMPPLWQYQTIELDAASQGRFGQYCHVYPHRNICQARNLIRVCRLLLNEAVLEYASPSAVDGASAGLTDIARDNAIRLAGEIYTSVAQFADCRTHAKHSQSHVPNKVPDVTNCRSHSPTHTGDCYTLIFPLYAAGRTHISKHMKHQILNYLYYIADHFRIRNAKNIAQSLEREQGRQPGVWDVYAKLGSYAFHM
ncbi:uncharacterized protein HMPREF1541_10734 [Cyphellophora europaea CBS 101466]|uniref:Uncharacterized protein n=1 Tax=Cyphellophora europaea (strain CBS 101466) TaxID=1220924 RepID=W2S8B7_CYPE1|nr:uncharacterized protein HMPREF1541_10734 [Cyphellophora europaea CBS 101466]ETN44184.1 hypothetical protein HMPREF1541_10734 [Cyphellophora europaea CBS 101466]